MHIWVDIFRLPLRKSGEAYHMTSCHWRGTEEHHVIFPSHWDWKRSTSRDRSSPLWWGAGHITWSLLITVMVSWTMKMRSGGQSLKLSDWLLGLKWIDMGCFRSDLGPRAGDSYLQFPLSHLRSQSLSLATVLYCTITIFHIWVKIPFFSVEGWKEEIWIWRFFFGFCFTRSACPKGCQIFF